MSHITALLIDGPGDGQKFALQDDLHTVEFFSPDNRTTYRYQIQRFLLGDQMYMVGSLDASKADRHEVAKKIREAKLDPIVGAYPQLGINLIPNHAVTSAHRITTTNTPDQALIG